jgi:hypothetical protein
MSALPEHFAELVRSTVPEGDRLALAQDWPNRIRDYLHDHDFETVEPHTRLTGSYSRRTAIGAIKDVDILVFVPAATQDGEPSHVLSSLEGALQEYPDSTIDTKVQRRSVRVSVAALQFDVDVVPAIIDGDDHSGVLLIPDKHRRQWVLSQPLGYGQALSALNQEHGKKVKPQVRLLKYWRDLRMTYMQPKSYWLECLTFHAFENGSVAEDGMSAGPLFADLLEHLVDRLGPAVDGGGVPRISDPMLKGNVAAGWEHSHAKALVNRLRTDANYARQAVDCEDDDEAVELWTKVFPGVFPSDPSDARDALSSLLLGSRASVTASGILVPSRSTGTVDLPPVRAYGDK